MERRHYIDDSELAKIVILTAGSSAEGAIWLSDTKITEFRFRERFSTGLRIGITLKLYRRGKSFMASQTKRQILSNQASTDRHIWTTRHTRTAHIAPEQSIDTRDHQYLYLSLLVASLVVVSLFFFISLHGHTIAGLYPIHTRQRAEKKTFLFTQLMLPLLCENPCDMPYKRY